MLCIESTIPSPPDFMILVDSFHKNQENLFQKSNVIVYSSFLLFFVVPIINCDVAHSAESPFGVIQYRTIYPSNGVQKEFDDDSFCKFPGLNVSLITPTNKSQKESTADTITGTIASLKNCTNPT